MTPALPGPTQRPTRSRFALVLIAALTWLASGPAGAALAQTDPPATVSAVSPGAFVTTVSPSAAVPITLSREAATPILGFSVSLTLSGLTSTTAAITEGGFLAASGGSTSFHVTDNGGGSFTVDGVTLGTPCGSSATSGTLFTVAVGSTLDGGSGTVTLDAVTLRDCDNVTLPSAVGTGATVNVDRSAPAVAITSPNGGERWLRGSTHAITWSASDAEGIGANGVTLEYSVDDGSTWLPVGSGLANSGTFDWAIPDSPSVTARVRATALDVNGNPASDASDAAFTIQGTTTTSLASSPNPSVAGESVTLTATVAPSGASGSVEFFDGATSLGAAPVSGGTATLVTSSLPVGVHSLTASYLGDANHSGSTSSAVSLEIQAKIVATAGANGSITPSGTVLVSLGGTPSFTFAADPGHHVTSVTVDGAGAALTSPYTFAPVSANHTIDVQFAVNPAVAAITTLASTQLRTGNDGDGTTRIALTWSAVPVGFTVEVWRKGYGNYPEYDDGPSPGSTPVTPGAYPPAGWTLTGVVHPGDSDEPATRDFWYYVAYVRDTFGTVSPVSNRTAGALNYHLGDVSDLTTVGVGDNHVTTSDLSALGMHYGLTGPALAPFNYLDVGPTTDLSVTARPLTDDKINFEDLVMFALNYFPVTSAPQAHARPAAAAADGVTLSAPAHAAAGDEVAVRLMFSGTGRMMALSVKLAWDPAVVEPVSYTAGDAVLAQGGLVLSAEPGSVDGAAFTGAGEGLQGEGEFATVRFRVLAPGDPRFGFAGVDARDAQNQALQINSGVLAVAPKAWNTAFAPAMPNPFGRTTTFRFSLARGGPAELDVFSVAGRRVRALASGVREAGDYRVEWNGTDDSGRPLAAGIYYVRLRSAQARFTRAVIYLK